MDKRKVQVSYCLLSFSWTFKDDLLSVFHLQCIPAYPYTFRAIKEWILKSICSSQQLESCRATLQFKFFLKVDEIDEANFPFDSAGKFYYDKSIAILKSSS